MALEEVLGRSWGEGGLGENPWEALGRGLGQALGGPLKEGRRGWWKGGRGGLGRVPWERALGGLEKDLIVWAAERRPEGGP